MSLLFLDTSALLKRYLPEIGSNWLINFLANQQISISELALYEAATVLRRRYQEGSLTRRQAAGLYARLRQHSKAYSVILLRSERQLPRVISLAFNLTPEIRLRALDSIHLAAALVSLEAAHKLTPPEPFIFVSSDRQLLQAAQALGLAIENPEDYP